MLTVAEIMTREPYTLGPDDSLADARRLAKLLRPVKAKINLIPFNPYPGSPFGRPGERTIHAFQEVLLDKHLTSVVRYSKGQDIMAACGQLRAGDATKAEIR